MAQQSGELKRVLGFKDLFAQAAGHIIGVGIMTLLGSAIALTGRSIPFSFIISAVIVIGYSLPYIFICSVARVNGGYYTCIAMLVDKRLCGLNAIMNVVSNLTLGMYAISLASYFISFFGIGNEKIIAAVALTLIFVINIVGVEKMALVQNLVVPLVCIALALFVGFGLPNIQPDYFSDGFVTGGVTGFFQAGGLLVYAIAGASTVASMSGEAKNPTRDIPRAIIAATLAMCVLYALVSVVAAGVLPVEQVANQNLALVAEAVLPRPLYVFFMVCGSMLALVSVLNAQFSMGTRPMLQACRDGWFPKRLGYIHPKFGTPTILLTILYAVGMLTIISGVSIGTITNLCVIANTLSILITCIGVVNLPKVCPTGWAKSKFHVSRKALVAISVYASIAQVVSIALNLSQLSPLFIADNVVVVIIAVVFALARYKYTDIEKSYFELGTDEEA